MDSKHKQKPATNEINFNKPQWEKKTYAKDKKKDESKPLMYGLSKVLHHCMEYHQATT